MKFHAPTKLRSVALGGAASVALVAGFLAAPAAQAITPTWSTPVDVGDVTNGDLLNVTLSTYFTGSGYVSPIVVSYVDDTTASKRSIRLSISTDDGDTFSGPVEFSAACSSIGSLATAMYDDTLAAAYTCDDTVVLSTASINDVSSRDDVTVSRAASGPNGFVGVGFAGSPFGTAFSSVVSWVEDGTSDDTGYLAVTASGIDNTWNRDDSPIAIATGTTVLSSEMLHPLGFQGGSAVVAFNTDDTITITKVPRFFNSGSLQSTYTVATGVSSIPSLGGSGDLEYILASWTNADDTVQSVISSQGSGSFPNPPYDVTSTSGDRGPASSNLGYSGGLENIARRVLVFDDTVSGTRQVTGTFSDDSTTFSSTTLSVADETVVSTPALTPTLNANSTFDRSAISYWVAEFGGNQRVKSAVGSELTPGNGNTLTWGTTATVYDDTATVSGLTGYSNALAWFADYGSHTEIQVSVLSFGSPGPGPGPGPAPGPTPTPATPPSAPASAEAVAQDGAATVSWSAPSQTGSFPVTNYQVQSSPSSSGCLVPATSTECTVAGLRNGVEYTFEVRALNGGGWSSWAKAGTVTPGPGPSPEASILITGSRANNDRVAKAEGVTTGLVGATVQAMVTLGGTTEVITGSTRTVNSAGEFSWKRRTSRSVEVYFTSGDISSNTITIPARG